MINAFAYIAVHSAKNKIVMRLRRLRQPRYLISAILGVAYFWFFFTQRSASRHQKLPTDLSLALGDLGMTCGAVVIFALMVLAWALPEDSGGLEFTPSEVQFLFTAPVSRAQLLIYKIFRSQLQVLFSTLIFSFFSRLRGNFLGFWFAFSVLALYFTMVKLGRARLRMLHVGFLARAAIAVAVLVAMYVYVAREITGSFRLLLPHTSNPRQLMEAAARPFHSEPLHSLIFLPKLFVTTAVGHLPAALVSAGMLAVAGLLFFWIAVWFDVSFEEASLVASQKKADKKERDGSRRRGTQVSFKKMPAPFRLHPEGRSEVAVFWKNLIAAGRVSSFFILLLVACVLFVILLASVGRHAGKDTMFALTGSITMIVGGMFALFGPLMLKNDLRMDINRMEVLKSYPISGERLILSEIAAPLLITGAIEIVALLTGVLQLRIGLGGKAAFFTSPEFLVAVMIFAIPITAVEFLIHNGAVILFPGWAVPSREDVRGIGATGYGMLIMIMHLATLSLFLIPSAIIFVPLFFLAQRFVSAATAVAIGAIPAVALLVVEIQFALRFLGEQFEEVDVSNDIEPGTT